MKSRRPAGLHHFFANRVHLRFTAAAATVAVLVGTGLVSPLGAAAGDLDPTPALELEATQAFEAENTPVVEAGGTPGLETTQSASESESVVEAGGRPGLETTFATSAPITRRRTASRAPAKRLDPQMS